MNARPILRKLERVNLEGEIVDRVVRRDGTADSVPNFRTERLPVMMGESAIV